MKRPYGIVASVTAGSPASLAGIAPGSKVYEADGHVLHDALDWRWWADADSVSLVVSSGEEKREVELAREPGQDWGIEFDDVLFDGVMPCCNNCTFCFMKMLPDDARPSLKVRDDDYRLSFIQGNFVTFTNLSDAHVQRIVEQRLSPLRFSLHASNPAVRAEMIGSRAVRGIEVAEQLLDAGIELHAQIVLVPGVNDGMVLQETLSWAWEREGFANVGIVPLGYTKHQTSFSHGFDTPESARSVIDLIEPFRRRARDERGCAWVHASDEFYRIAYGDSLVEHIPPAADYGDFELYEDGIGMVRSYVDDWSCCEAQQQKLAGELSALDVRVLMVSGEATSEFVDPLLSKSPLFSYVEALHVHNGYFGGNVDVTGLLCGCDIARAVKARKTELSEDDPGTGIIAVVPNSILNSDGITLDGMTLDKMSGLAGVPVHVVSCQPSETIADISSIAAMYGGSGKANTRREP